MQALRGEDQVRRLVGHIHVEVDIGHGRIRIAGFHLLKHWGLVLKVMRWKGLLVVHLERIQIGKLIMMHLMHLRREQVHSIGLLSGMKGVVRSRHR